LQNRPWSTCEAWKSPGQDFRYFFIATNAHLARGEESFSVQLSSEPELHAKVAYIDDNLDIAFVKAEDPSGILAFRHLTLRDSSDVRQGEIVMAIGNPGDAMRFSATQGIVSAVGEFPNAGPGTWIQTDAPINPGNSGGPLPNLRGEVVGINTQKLTLKNVTGIGFALSASHLVTVLRRFYPKEPRHGEKSQDTGHTMETLTAPVEAEGFGTVALKKPEGAEIWIDHALVGYIPSTFKLKAVKHTFVVKDHVHADWIRQIYVLKDSEVTLQPDLQ
jgi:serine protease Do